VSSTALRDRHILKRHGVQYVVELIGLADAQGVVENAAAQAAKQPHSV
jgi:hypothetical protein